MEILKNIKGVVEVTGYRNGEQFYYDKGENTVTIWAKHAMIHLLTGEAFSTHGAGRDFTGHSLTSNPDGTLISGEQYFTDYAGYGIDKMWSRNSINVLDSTDENLGAATTEDNWRFPLFPTKLLLGTGVEYQAWGDISAEDQSVYESYGYNSGNFGTPTGGYSANWNGSTIVDMKTMNDNASGALTDVITTEDFAIKGAIKSGGYSDTSETSKIVVQNDVEYLTYDLRGIGEPSFIYCKRDDRFFKSSSEILVSNDDNKIENKITFSAVLPEQTGTPKSFYPYNGYDLKQIGLFTDARINFANNVLTGGVINDEYKKMPQGILFSKRNIAPITKAPEVSINIKWTFYL